MVDFVNQVFISLDEGKAVSIQGDSGVGKSENIKLLKCLLEQEGKRTVYVDMRNFKSHSQFYSEVSKQLGLNGDRKKILSELDKGDVSLLLDEYWAGAGIANQLVQYAHRSNNDVVTIAGNPLGVELDEYLLKKRR
ncbi:AAA family ATPase [Candidatus Pacearchaeota archaeon]|nr:AAA family ATPase [Candidatus Pacearchaeota archaeon]